MAEQLKKTIALVGMMGAGKTAVGRVLAELLGVEFKDSDQEIELAANRKISEIFERDGEPFFRDREAEVLSRLMVGTPAVLSTGGGAYLQERNRQVIHDAGVAVWLKADVELLWSRVRTKDTRPLLRTADPRATLEGLCNAREPFYSKAEITVEAHEDYALEDMAEQVIKALRQRPDVLGEID